MTQLQKGYYSVVQYCPDLSRGEAANVGVLLFCPNSGFLKSLTSTNNRRLRRFFGEDHHDWKRISSVKESLNDRLHAERAQITTLAELQQFIATRANALQITAPRSIKVTDPERELLDLYEALVEPAIKRKPRTGFRELVGHRFAAAGLQQKLLHEVTVQIPVLNQEVEIPFGFQNGRFNLIRPVGFRSEKAEPAIKTACKCAVEGHSLYQHCDARLGKLQLVVVGQFRPDETAARDTVRRILQDSDVKLFTEEELPVLIDEIRRTGKDIAPAT